MTSAPIQFGTSEIPEDQVEVDPDRETAGAVF